MSVQHITSRELSAMIAGAEPPLIIDVRTESERASFGWIAGSVPVDGSSVPAYLQQHPPGKDTPLVIVCQSGARSSIAAHQVDAAGYPAVFDLAGGILSWMLLRLPLRH